MVSVTTAPAGAAAREVLGRRLDELRGGSVLGPAVVICQTSALAVGLRRALGARPRGIAGVTFTTVNRLIERLAGPDLVASDGRVAKKAELLTAIRAELQAQPGAFGRVADHRTTEERLAAFHQELVGLPVDVLDRMAEAATGLSADAIRVTRAAVDRMGRAAGGDRLLAAALDELDRLEAGALGPLVLYTPEPDRPYEGRMVQALARRSDCEVLVATTGVTAIDERHFARLAGWSIQIDGGRVNDPVDAKRSTVLEVTDPEEEVRAALRDVAAHAAAGVSLNDMALLYTSTEPYASLLVDHLRASGLPFSGPGHRRLSTSLAGRTLRRLLSLSVDGMERGAVITLLSAAPIDDGYGREVPAAEWNLLSRQAGVIDGDHWIPRLAELAGGLDDDGGKESTVALSAFVEELAERLRPPTERSWTSWSSWAVSLLDRYLLFPTDGDEPSVEPVLDLTAPVDALTSPDTTATPDALNVPDMSEAVRPPTAGPAAWPHDELTAFGLVRSVLDELATLDDIGVAPTLDTFESAVVSELGSLRVPGRPMGHGVYVGPVDSVAGLDFERITVIGLTEGTFPRTPREDSLLPDQLRAVGGGLLNEKSTVTDIDTRAVALAATSSRRPAMLLTARGDLRSNRSRTWPRVLDPIVGSRQTLDSHHQGLVDHGRPVGTTEFGLRSLISHVDGDNLVDTHELAAIDPVLSANLERVRNRRRPDITRHAGRVPAGSFDPTEHLLSPTALETYASCPRKYLFQRVLRLGEDERPERIDEITPRDRGTLVHRVLERFVADALSADEVPTPDEEWTPEQRAHLFEILEQEVKSAEARGVTGGQVKTKLLHRSLINEMNAFLDRDNELRSERRSTPMASEFSFGFADSPALEGLWAGRRMQLRGSVDRVDLTEDGGVLVIDYKGGSGSAFRGMDENPLDDGRRLQLPLYARAVAERLERSGHRTGLYWLTKMDDIKEMVLDTDLEDRLESAVGAALDGIGDGVFPGVPGDVVGWPRLSFENCRFCDFDRICPTDRQSEWERVRSDSTLTPIDLLLRRLGGQNE